MQTPPAHDVGVWTLSYEPLLDAIEERLKLYRAPDPPKEWLSVKSAAEYLDTTEHSIRGMVKRRQLPFHRSETGVIRFKRSDLDRHAEGTLSA